MSAAGDLEGRVGVVTGGAGGIGRAIGRALLARGAAVVLTDVAGAPAGSVAREPSGVRLAISDAHGLRAAIGAVVPRLPDIA